MEDIFLHGFSPSGQNCKTEALFYSVKTRCSVCVLAGSLKQWSKAKLINKPLSVLTHSALHRAKLTFCSLSLLKTDGLFLPIQSLCCDHLSGNSCNDLSLSLSPSENTPPTLASILLPLPHRGPLPHSCQTRAQLVVMATTPSAVHAACSPTLILNISTTFCLALHLTRKSTVYAYF